MPKRRLFFGRRAYKRWDYAPDPRWLSVILAALLLTIFFLAANARIRPILTAMATTRISNAVVAAVNDAITDGIVQQQISYSDMIHIETDAEGRVAVLTSNLEVANLLRAQLLSLVIEAVSELASEDFFIPLGNLTNVDLLSGRGPNITIQVLSTGSANATFDHQFSDAGVNQTLHQIMLAIDVTVQILLPGQAIELPISTQVCIAETIVVGQVPETYLEWEP